LKTPTRSFFFSNPNVQQTHTDHAEEGLLLPACQGKVHFQETAHFQDVSEKEAWLHVWTQSQVEVEPQALLLEE
jgi:hypothetical protein